jgi:hypothetical protein
MAMDARGLGCLLLLLLIGLRPLPGQSAQEPSSPEAGFTGPESFIGLTLEGLYGRFGVPQAVRAVRGGEPWQDDVVMVYPQGDFYVYRDRVWQAGIPAIRGIHLGDSRDAVVLALGEGALEEDGCFILPIRDRAWPMALRVNMESPPPETPPQGSPAPGNPSQGSPSRVSGIFVYRSDF